MCVIPLKYALCWLIPMVPRRSSTGYPTCYGDACGIVDVRFTNRRYWAMDVRLEAVIKNDLTDDTVSRLQ